MTKYLIGIDEAGRGPLAGPVAVGVAIVKKGKKPHILKIACDSKKISASKRDSIYSVALEARKNNDINFAVTLVTAKVIDSKGIVFAIQKAMAQCLEKIGALPHEVEIVLDGSLKAPSHFTKQKTIIKGDSKIPLIGLASICAKVERDRYMQRIAYKYPQYSFEIHKGYGTSKHRKAIKKYGLSKEHRATWCS